MFRFTAENFEVMLVKPSNGEGMAVLAPAWFAVKLSLLPNGTFQEGPPDCIYDLEQTKPSGIYVRVYKCVSYVRTCMFQTKGVHNYTLLDDSVRLN